MSKPSTPAVWAANKTFSFTPSSQQIAQGFDYIATIGRPEGAPITDDHDWPFNQVTQGLRWVMEQIPESGLKSAAFRDVGVLSDSIPDMSSFTRTSGQWYRFPHGLIIQFVEHLSQGTGEKVVNLPIPMPNQIVSITSNYNKGLGGEAVNYSVTNTRPSGKVGFVYRSFAITGSEQGAGNTTTFLVMGY